MSEHKPFLLKASEIEAQANQFSHPWNPKSHVHGTRLGSAVGLQRTGVGLAKLPPGKESFVYHAHHCEEEWIYILSGRGIAEINDQEFEVSAGDFMGFPTPAISATRNSAGTAHHLRNPYEAELVYLVGGENLEVEIVDFPHLGKRMLRQGTQVDIYDASDAQPFAPLEDWSYSSDRKNILLFQRENLKQRPQVALMVSSLLIHF